MKTKKKLENINCYDFLEPLDELLEMLQGLKDKYSGHTDLRLVYDYEGNFELYGVRPETEAEKKRRLATARRQRENRKKEKEREKEKEIKLLHKLKQRYPEE